MNAVANTLVNEFKAEIRKLLVQEKSKSQFGVEVTRLRYVQFLFLCYAYSIDTPTDFI